MENLKSSKPVQYKDTEFSLDKSGVEFTRSSRSKLHDQYLMILEHLERLWCDIQAREWRRLQNDTGNMTFYQAGHSLPNPNALSSTIQKLPQNCPSAFFGRTLQWFNKGRIWCTPSVNNYLTFPVWLVQGEFLHPSQINKGRSWCTSIIKSYLTFPVWVQGEFLHPSQIQRWTEAR